MSTEYEAQKLHAHKQREARAAPGAVLKHAGTLLILAAIALCVVLVAVAVPGLAPFPM